MPNWSKPWGKPEIILAIIGIVVAILAIAVPSVIWALGAFDPFGWNNAELESVAPIDSEYAVPSANGRAVLVPIQNRGNREAAVLKVELVPEEWLPTPLRQPIYGAGPPIYAYFEERHWDETKDAYVLELDPPGSVPAGEFSTLYVCIIDPAKVGQTCRGKVVVHYDGSETTSHKVEVDVLDREPE